MNLLFENMNWSEKNPSICMNRIESNKSYLEHNADPEERHQVVEVGECAVHQVDGVEVKECKRVGNKGHYAHIHEHRALQQKLELKQDIS